MEGIYWGFFGMAWVFGWVVVGLVGKQIKTKRQNERLRIIHEERMKAMEKGIPLPEFPELEERDDDDPWGESTSAPANPRAMLGAAAITASIGAGISTVFYVWGAVSGIDWVGHLWPIGLLPVFIAIGMVLYHILTQPEES